MNTNTRHEINISWNISEEWILNILWNSWYECLTKISLVYIYNNDNDFDYILSLLRNFWWLTQTEKELLKQSQAMHLSILPTLKILYHQRSTVLVLSNRNNSNQRKRYY